MNTLLTWTFYWRHKRRAGLLIGPTAMVTVAIYLTVALMWATGIEPGRTNARYPTRFSVVVPGSAGGGPNPAVIAPIRTHPDLARFVPTSWIWMQLPGIFSGKSLDPVSIIERRS